ncbi:adenosylcobalamin-dependent ribonucleoside-diphosphate reductase [Candidatus Woesearchaeota archaeon]|nr:adenosylcobalamin-dependent ribonucleoside-diphosphate reductase [Candidatus Woesearchaeota archaeon]
MPLEKVIKRNGETVVFDPKKITDALYKAAQAIGGTDEELSKALTKKIVAKIEELFPDKIPHVEDVQDVVERVLIEDNHVKTAKAYILYRERQKNIREVKQSLVGGYVDKRFTINALKILKERLLMKKEDGAVETPEDMFRRVAKEIAKADKQYDNEPNLKETEDKFFECLNKLDFLPNSPCLMNAGTKNQQLISCYVLPIEDSTESIYTTLKNAAMVHRTGSGTGFSFSNLRPKEDTIDDSRGFSAGPIPFMHVYDKSTEIIKKTGLRRGANMAVLRVDHPNILDFITAKENPHHLRNFNISVGITKEFMDALDNRKRYPLINPRTKQEVRLLPAKEVFDLIATMSWKNGEPGVIFLDTINEKNPVPELGEIKTTSACGEVPLLEYEACPLGSINLSNMVQGGRVNLAALRDTAWIAVHFLDNVIDVNKYTLKDSEKITNDNRKIGVGVMGFADMLYQLGVPYNSEEAIKVAERIMKFIRDEARLASEALAKKRGVFANYEKSIYAKKGIKQRNATTTAIAPTGTISLIADCSSGIEPNFALSYMKKITGGDELLYVNKHLKSELLKREIYSEDLMKEIASKGSLQSFLDLASEIRKVFVISHEIPAEYHVLIQAAFQKYCDNAVSKSVNLEYTSSKEDVVKTFKLAYKLGCKGITIYRDRSREDQILTLLGGEAI